MTTETKNVASGTHLLHAAATITGLVAILSIGVEIFTNRWFAEAIGWPTFLSLPLGIGTIFFCGLTAKSPQIKTWPFVAIAIVFWALFVWGTYGA